MAVVLVLLVPIVAYLSFRPFVRWLVNRRLGPARQVVEGALDAPLERVSSHHRVAVIGGGLAGIAAASTLAERGFSVVLYEAEPELGGKITSWQVTLPDGSKALLCHGFHAFFSHYYNLNRFLDRLSLRKRFRSVGDYVIVERDGGTLSFAGIDTTPGLNLLSLARRKVFSLRKIVFGPARDLMGIFLEYEPDRTFERLDTISFAAFADAAQLPRRLRLAFGTFARAFFADEDRMSLAELVKCFHFYFLSHDGGLVYDYPAGDYETTLIAPIREHLEKLGVDLRLGQPVEGISRDEAGRFVVGRQTFDSVVIATNVVGARHIVTNASGLDPELVARLDALTPGQRYAVLRVWIDRQFTRALPDFVIIERARYLDALAICDRYEADAADWAKHNGGAVLELHCYAVDDDSPDDEAIRSGLLDELYALFPELVGAVVRHEDLKVRRDFPAFHVGRHAARPRVEGETPGLYFAGDWVHLDFPAMLMEGAFSSGLVAANRIFARVGLAPGLVESVPPRGIMAGLPWPPARERWAERARRELPPRT